MGIFKKKSKVEIDGFCRDFYGKCYLEPEISGINVGSIFCETSMKSITEVDSTFAEIDSNKFSDEITVLQFELFALAWLHKFGNRRALTQSIFTKHYLDDNKRIDIWENTTEYNKAISRSVIASKRNDESYINFMNISKADLADEYIKIVQEEYLDCIGRVCNRIFSEKAWKDTISANFLSFIFCERIGFKLDENNPVSEAQQRITFIIRSIYDGASQAFDNIKIID